jgi:predicted nucleic acid-binding protein
MKFLVDTNLISELTKARPDPAVRAWVSAHDAEMVMCWVSVAELRSGVALLPQGRRRDQLHEDVEALIEDFYEESEVPLQGATAEMVAMLAERNRAAGLAQGWPDIVIAAVAVEHGLVVATRNTSDFPGIPTINPSEAPTASGESGGRDA